MNKRKKPQDPPYRGCNQPATEAASVVTQCKILGQYLVQAAFSETSEDHGLLEGFFKRPFQQRNPSLQATSAMDHMAHPPLPSRLSSKRCSKICFTINFKADPLIRFIHLLPSSWALLFFKANSLMVSLHRLTCHVPPKPL